MKPSGYISLITDFGLQDTFVGVMKGVIARINPDARVIDLTHAVTPFDTAEAAFLLRDSWAFCPDGTVHVAVVDPGVGSDRDIVAMSAGGGFFLAPDTGILAPIEEDMGHDLIVRVTNGERFLPDVSSTFHGRDVFAPVAAHISLGVSLGEFGPAVGELRPLDRRAPEAPGRGVVVRFDRFGNLVTDIPRAAILDPANVRVRVAGHTLRGIRDTFARAAAGELVAFFGGFGHVEIAVNHGSAKDALGAQKGDPVEILPGDSL